MQWTWIVILVSIVIILIGLIILWVQGIDSQLGVTVTVLGLLIALIGLSAIIFGYWRPTNNTIEGACRTCDSFRQRKYMENEVNRSVALTAVNEQAQNCAAIRQAQAQLSRSVPQPFVAVENTKINVAPANVVQRTVRPPPQPVAIVPRSAEIFNLPAAKPLL